MTGLGRGDRDVGISDHREKIRNNEIGTRDSDAGIRNHRETNKE